MVSGYKKPNAAVGQSSLQALYETMFRNYGIMVGQVFFYIIYCVPINPNIIFVIIKIKYGPIQFPTRFWSQNQIFITKKHARSLSRPFLSFFNWTLSRLSIPMMPSIHLLEWMMQTVVLHSNTFRQKITIIIAYSPLLNQNWFLYIIYNR